MTTANQPHRRFDHETFESYVPTRQRTAREQAALGVCLPYFVGPDDVCVNYHLTLLVLLPEELDKLVMLCRRKAATFHRNPLDNRTTLDYPIRDRERHAFLRHSGLNRTPKNIHQINGYHNSYDSLLHRIAKKGIDVAERQLTFKRHVCALIAEYYPHLKTEGEYYLFRHECGLITRKGQKQ